MKKRKVLKINPNHTNANYNLGLTFYKLKKLKKAQDYFKKTTIVQKNYETDKMSEYQIYRNEL